MYCRTYEIAKQQAQDNANYFKVPYVLFTDTSGNYRVERRVIGPQQVDCEVFWPAEAPPDRQPVNELFHKLWGGASGRIYVKQDWMDLQALLQKFGFHV